MSISTSGYLQHAILKDYLSPVSALQAFSASLSAIDGGINKQASEGKFTLELFDISDKIEKCLKSKYEPLGFSLYRNTEKRLVIDWEPKT